MSKLHQIINNFSLKNQVFKTLKQNYYHFLVQVTRILGLLKKLIYLIRSTKKIIFKKLKTKKQSIYFRIIIIQIIPIPIKSFRHEWIIIGYQKVILKALIKYFIINSSLLPHRAYNSKMINLKKRYYLKKVESLITRQSQINYHL